MDIIHVHQLIEYQSSVMQPHTNIIRCIECFVLAIVE